VKRIEYYREMEQRACNIGDVTAAQANEYARAVGIGAAECKRQSAVMENERKGLQTRMRDALMAADEKLKASPAEAMVRVDPEYVAYCNEAVEWAELGEKLYAHARFLHNVAGLEMAAVALAGQVARG